MPPAPRVVMSGTARDWQSQQWVGRREDDPALTLAWKARFERTLAAMNVDVNTGPLPSIGLPVLSEDQAEFRHTSPRHAAEHRYHARCFHDSVATRSEAARCVGSGRPRSPWPAAG